MRASESKTASGSILPGLLLGFHAGVDALPFDGNAGRFDGANGGVGDLRADPVAGN